MIMVGKFLESRNVQKTKGAIIKLMDLRPDVAILAESGTEVPTASLKAGDLILIKPGAKIAADGTVTKGRAASTRPCSPVRGAGGKGDRQHRHRRQHQRRRGAIRLRDPSGERTPLCPKSLNLWRMPKEKKRPSPALQTRWRACLSPWLWRSPCWPQQCG